MARETGLQRCVDMTILRARERLVEAEKASSAIGSAVSDSYPSGSSHRDLAEVLLGHVVDRAAELVVAGQFPWAYVEMHAVLREQIVWSIALRVAGKEHKTFVANQFTRKTLSEVASYCHALGYWSADDVRVAIKLEEIASSVFERDFERLRRNMAFKKDDQFSYDGCELALAEVAADLARTIALLIKVDRPHTRKYRGREKAGRCGR